MEVEIIKATDKNSKQVLAIFNHDRKNMTYLPALHTDEETKDFIYRLIEEGNLYVALQAGEVAGFIDIKDSWVHHLYVDPVFQNKGVGKCLLDFAKRKFPTGLSLWVFEQNTRAIIFYEREGFSMALKRDALEADNEEGLPDRKYVWQPS